VHPSKPDAGAVKVLSVSMVRLETRCVIDGSETRAKRSKSNQPNVPGTERLADAVATGFHRSALEDE
jgi:hypothetical protein